MAKKQEPPETVTTWNVRNVSSKFDEDVSFIQTEFEKTHGFKPSKNDVYLMIIREGAEVLKHNV